MTDEAKALTERLREVAIKSGRAIGAFLADDVSNDFLELIPAEIEAFATRMKEANAEQAAELAKWKALAETLAGALEQMHRAVCHETGFAEAVRADSGVAYPWEPLDVAADASIKALTSYKEQRDAS